MKKLSVFFLLLIICISLAPGTVASTNSSHSSTTLASDEVDLLMPTIYAALTDSSFLSETVITSKRISIGTPINTYELLNDCTISKMDVLMYPIFYNNEPIFEVFVTSTNSINVSKVFHKALSNYNNQSIAIIYDQNSVYIIDQPSLGFSPVTSFATPIMQRGVLDEITNISSFSQIEWSYLEPSVVSVRLPSSSSRSDAVFPTTTLPTGIVRQTSTNICWAACTACIGNFLTPYNYTSQYVAQTFYGDDDFNRLATLSNSTTILRSLYGVNYPNVETITVPNDFLIYDNIAAGYPMYGRWQSTMTTYHQTVIRGISIQNNCIYVMDPEIGYVIVYKTGGEYNYVSASGLTIRLIGYASKM